MYAFNPLIRYLHTHILFGEWGKKWLFEEFVKIGEYFLSHLDVYQNVFFLQLFHSSFEQTHTKGERKKSDHLNNEVRIESHLE